MMPQKSYSETEIVALLRGRGVNPTSQRVLITRVLFARCAHMSAEDVYKVVNNDDQHVSKATVYNTLGLLADRGVIREVIADPTKIFYDPNTTPHHHFYNVDTGELTDIPSSNLHVVGLPPLPQGANLEGVDVIVRLKQST